MEELYFELKSFIDASIKREDFNPNNLKKILTSSLKKLWVDEDFEEEANYKTAFNNVHSILMDSGGNYKSLTREINKKEADELIFTIQTLRDNIYKLSIGDLSQDFKIKGFMGGALKALQANLRHITWQTQVVASGDYSQRIDFMGEFSDAFNSMVTQLDSTIKTLIKQDQELLEINATKDKFFSIIAHDLKGPLGSFRNLITLLSEDFQQLNIDEIKEILVVIRESSNNLLSLLENLLIWSRKQRGQILSSPSIIDIYSVSEQVFSLLNALALVKGITLESRITNETYLYADENLTDTVLRNIVSNAIKFTPVGGKIIVTAKEFSEDDNYIVLSVIDNGVGMEDAIKQKLFKLDMYSSAPGTAGEEGTGLGLIICKEFVKLMDGKIWVESELNVGTTISFILPKKQFS